jgi:1,4-alpha-glucan branching enzyme
VLGSEPLTGYGLPWGDVAPEAIAGVAADSGLARQLQPAWIADSRVAAMVREPHTARQVWSRQVGYPGDPRYLDFHKRHTPSGLRLWRVTDAEADLADKLPYWPADAQEAARSQARHFLGLVQSLPGLDGRLAVCPFDAELFGHWWYEGPLWLEEVLRACQEEGPVRTSTPEAELEERPPRRRRELAEGSWGEGGDHGVWLQASVDGMWAALGAAEERVATLVEAAGEVAESPPGRLRAILAQLLLLAASDWPFLVSRGTAEDYAAARFSEHHRRLQELLGMRPGDPLPSWVDEDLPSIELDARWWARPPAATDAPGSARAGGG